MVKHSVILANFNGGAFLEDAVRSVLAQSDNDFELVVVDDCSTDDSLSIIQGAALTQPDKVRVLSHQKNSGQSAGFNTGFSACSGELISFIDSDDFWFSSKLARVRECFSGEALPSLYAHNLQLFRNGSLTDELAIDAISVGNLLRHWQRKQAFPMFPPTTGLTFHRSTLKKIMPMPETLRISADGFLTRSAICFGRVIGDMESYGAYRIHDDNNVVGNERHDAWLHFLENIAPELRRFYTNHDIELPGHLIEKKKPNLVGRVRRRILR